MLHFTAHALHVFSSIVDTLPEYSNFILILMGFLLSSPTVVERIENNAVRRYSVVSFCVLLGGGGFVVSIIQRHQAASQMTVLVNNVNNLVMETTSLVTTTNNVGTLVAVMLPQVLALNDQIADIKQKIAVAKGNPQQIAHLQAQAAVVQAQADAASRKLLLATLSGVVGQMQYWAHRWDSENSDLRNQMNMLSSDRTYFESQRGTNVDERISELKKKQADLNADYSKQVMPIMTNANYLREQLLRSSEATQDDKRSAAILARAAAGDVITWSEMRFATDYMANLAAKR